MNIGNLNRKKIGIVMAVLVAIILPITIFTIMRQQDTRSGASGSATLQLQPVQGSYNIGDQIQVAATISAGTNNIAYVKASFQFDKTKFRFIDFTKSSKFNEFLTNAAVGGVNEDTVSFEMINTDQAPNTGNVPLGTLTFEALTAGTGDINFNPIEAYAAGDITPIQNPTTGAKATYTISTATSISYPTIVKDPVLVTYVPDANARPWANEGNARTSNNAYTTTNLGSLNATGTSISQSLYAKSFGFNIPANATIQGIRVRVERKSNAGTTIKDQIVALTKNGTAPIGNLSETATWGPSKIYKTYGGATTLWGTTWTPAEINSSSFGVHFAVSATTANAIAAVDHIEVGIYYTTPTSATCNDAANRPAACSCETPAHCGQGLSCQGATGAKTCQTLKPAGSACTETTDCASGLTCEGTTGAKTCQTTTTNPKPVGGQCTETSGCQTGLTCEGVTRAKTCQATTTACQYQGIGDYNCDSYVDLDDLTEWVDEWKGVDADATINADIADPTGVGVEDLVGWRNSYLNEVRKRP